MTYRNYYYVKICLISVLSLFTQVTGVDILCDKVPSWIEGKTEIVETTNGKVVGLIENSREIDSHLQVHNLTSLSFYSSFKGIRYAEPPTGKNRFTPPIKAKPWTHIYKAFYDGNICPQLKNYGFYGDFLGNEDCLFLNVYTPVLDFSFNHNKSIVNPKKAVMVWIHGGGFISGTGNSWYFGPDFFVRQDVVLVSFNYRLGAPGFLNNYSKLISGNAGLKDQTLVLKWVKENIERFGGDPDRITIFGQSSGAVAVDLHAISESSKNLFSRAIALSGSVFCPWATQHNPFKKTSKLSKKIKFCVTGLCSGAEDNDFINADIEELTKLTPELFDIDEYELPFAPSIEDIFEPYHNEPFLNKCYLDKIKEGNSFHGDYMFGETSLEANLLERIFETIVQMENSPYSVLDKIYKLSHIMFDYPIKKRQMYLQKYGRANSSYRYIFGYEESRRKTLKGSAHTDDLVYLFYEYGRNQICNKNSNNKDVQIRKHFINMLTSFAKNGNPKSGEISWPDYAKHNKFLDITQSGNILTREGHPLPERCVMYECPVIKENERCDDENLNLTKAGLILKMLVELAKVIVSKLPFLVPDISVMHV